MSIALLIQLRGGKGKNILIDFALFGRVDAAKLTRFLILRFLSSYKLGFNRGLLSYMFFCGTQDVPSQKV